MVAQPPAQEKLLTSRSLPTDPPPTTFIQPHVNEDRAGGGLAFKGFNKRVFLQGWDAVQHS
jgi:hypothetical protein